MASDRLLLDHSQAEQSMVATDALTEKRKLQAGAYVCQYHDVLSLADFEET